MDEECPGEIAQDAWESFKMVYRDPDDIDLFAGGLAEKALTGKRPILPIHSGLFS